MKIYSIEVVSACNYRCGYCPMNHDNLSPVYMSKKTADRIIEIISPGNDVVLSFRGEPLLAPDMVKYLADNIENILVITNGSMLTEDLLQHQRIKKFLVSVHNRQTFNRLQKFKHHKNRIIATFIGDQKASTGMSQDGWTVEIKKKRNLGYQDNSVAGIESDQECLFLRDNCFVVYADGKIGTCCECMDGKTGIIGNIWDDIPDHNTRVSLCATCIGYTWDNKKDKVRL